MKLKNNKIRNALLGTGLVVALLAKGAIQIDRLNDHYNSPLHLSRQNREYAQNLDSTLKGVEESIKLSSYMTRLKIIDGKIDRYEKSGDQERMDNILNECEPMTEFLSKSIDNDFPTEDWPEFEKKLSDCENVFKHYENLEDLKYEAQK